MKRKISRREFLLGLLSTLGGLTLGEFFRTVSKAQALRDKKKFVPMVSYDETYTPTSTPTRTRTPTRTSTSSPTGGPPAATPTRTRTRTPTSTRTPTPTKTSTPTTGSPPPLGDPVVKHIRSRAMATAMVWDAFGTKPFYEWVDQLAVDAAVERGLQELTGQNTWQTIWNVLFSRVQAGGYSAGQKIAIKVNFNGSARGTNSCSSHDNAIDALPQPVNGLLKGLKAIGVPMTDVYIFDSSRRFAAPYRAMPAYFRNAITALYPGVHFVNEAQCGGTAPAFGKNASLTVTFPQFPPLTDRKLENILYDVTYLINVPILKFHSGNGGIPFTASFKNHLGSIDLVHGDGSNSIHYYLAPSDSRYNPNASPLVDIYKNSNIVGKTILTVADGIYGSNGGEWAQYGWVPFGNQPAASLFFAIDPVALDTVLGDILRAEGVISIDAAYDYLFVAQAAGLGHTEGTRSNPGGNPFQQPYGSGYSTIIYSRTDI